MFDKTTQRCYENQINIKSKKMQKKNEMGDSISLFIFKDISLFSKFVWSFWSFSSHSRNFHSFGDVTFAQEGLVHEKILI